jgi:hypothetical protein
MTILAPPHRRIGTMCKVLGITAASVIAVAITSSTPRAQDVFVTLRMRRPSPQERRKSLPQTRMKYPIPKSRPGK